MSKPLEVIVSDGQGRYKNALEKAAKLLSEVPNGYEAAISRSMNRAATAGRSAAVSTIRQEYTIKASTVRRNFTIHKATRSDLEALVTSKGPRIPLVNYKTRPKTDTTGNARKPVLVAVKARGGLKPLGKSFVYRGKILQRLDTSSLPVQEVYGPAIPVLSGNNEVVDNVEKTMQETFLKRLDHETGYLLGGGKTNKYTKHKGGFVWSKKS
jgi:hypothetical protein|nr:MAG TPA: minor tail protein Z [Caudoviricetes sp.]